MVDDHGSSHDEPFVNGMFTRVVCGQMPMILLWANYNVIYIYIYIILCYIILYISIATVLAFGVDIRNHPQLWLGRHLDP